MLKNAAGIACCIVVFLGSMVQVAMAQTEDYSKVALSRAEKIVSTLDIKKEKKAKVVTKIIAAQYVGLNNIQTEHEAKVAALKKDVADKEAKNTALGHEVEAMDARKATLHAGYIKALQKHLTPVQVNKVKDGMTYNVVNITYAGYLDMLPNLTEAQKKQIMAWLVEAREHAMDAETSQKKHAWFGKYKGRINNYLSAAGYNLKQAGDEWEERIKARTPKTQG